MKKLMIAVAAAAMIGVVQADYVWGLYDFSASLKTTKAKEGKGYTDSYKVELGQDENNDWWYESDIFNIDDDDGCGYYPGSKGDEDGYKVLTFDSKGVGKLSIGNLGKKSGAAVALKSDEKEALKDDLAWELEDYARITLNKTIISNLGKPDIHKGKEKWCANFSYKLKNPGVCYRVAGSQKIQTTYFAQECCVGNGTDDLLCRFESTKLMASDEPYYNQFVRKNDIVLPDLTTTLLLRFGGESFEKSTKVEYVGNIFSEGLLPQFALAGQGSWKAKLLNNISGLESISGNIVGLWYDPECEVCCGKNNLAIAFSYCDGCDLVWATTEDEDCDFVFAYDANNDWYENWFASQGMYKLWGTAAWGSFKLKFNKNLTQKLYN